MRLVLTLLLTTLAPAQILIHDDHSQPESLTVVASGPLAGTVLVGSASSPFIYKLKPVAELNGVDAEPGPPAAEVFYDASAEPAGTFFFGMLADPATNTLFACQLTPVPDSKPLQRHTALLALDLKTAALKLRWNLPGDNSTCNDFALGPDRSLYITDTANGRIYKLPADDDKLTPTATATLFMENAVLVGVDGICFLDGVLYVNNVRFNKLYRIPVDQLGKPLAPVDIWMDAPVRGPDGMRAAHGKLYVAENAHGRITALTLRHTPDGDIAHVDLIQDGLTTPTGVEPTPTALWFTERATGKIYSVPLPK